MSINDRTKGFSEGTNAKERPDFCSDEHLEYLDELREYGITNMFGAGPYLQREFPRLDDKEASAVLGYWMKTFGDSQR